MLLTDTQHLVEIDEETVSRKSSAITLSPFFFFFPEKALKKQACWCVVFVVCLVFFGI